MLNSRTYDELVGTLYGVKPERTDSIASVCNKYMDAVIESLRPKIHGVSGVVNGNGVKR